MSDKSDKKQYLWLWILGLTIGWFEASIVVYLRELYYPNGFAFPIVAMPARIAWVEIIREAASILLLMAAACVAANTSLQRFARFMLLFGIWDLAYYVFLKLTLGWPASLSDWDVLFLIPAPWIGPVWAPSLISVLLVLVGSYLIWTPDRPRRYRPAHYALAILAGAIATSSFLVEWSFIVEKKSPLSFPAFPFWLGVIMGSVVFMEAEFQLSSRIRR
jgi:hypothetical protein